MHHYRLGNGHADDSIDDGWTHLKHVVPLLQQEATQALLPEDVLLFRVPNVESRSVSKLALQMKRDAAAEDDGAFKVRKNGVTIIAIGSSRLFLLSNVELRGAPLLACPA